MNIQKVCVIGGGLMGRQIALNTAIYPYEVTCYQDKINVVRCIDLGYGTKQIFCRIWIVRTEV